MPGILHDEREIDTDRRKKRRSAERRFGRKMDVLVSGIVLALSRCSKEFQNIKFDLQMQTAARSRTLSSGGSHSGKKGFVA